MALLVRFLLAVVLFCRFLLFPLVLALLPVSCWRRLRPFCLRLCHLRLRPLSVLLLPLLLLGILLLLLLPLSILLLPLLLLDVLLLLLLPLDVLLLPLLLLLSGLWFSSSSRLNPFDASHIHDANRRTSRRRTLAHLLDSGWWKRTTGILS